MMTNNKDIKGLVVRAKDGEIGSVQDLYFDDQTWGIRYLTVETGSWLSGREVLVSPVAIQHIDWQTRRIDVSLTRKQIEDSPSIDTHKPVSRQHEVAYLGYYSYPYYWDGPYLWGPTYVPSPAAAGAASEAALEDRIHAASADTHLRSTVVVTGYHIEAKDGEIGHLDRFIVDDEAWVIRYLEVATRNWWPGKRVLMPPAWVESVSWEESKVFVAATREKIRTAPEFMEFDPITREYENKLYFHYGQPPYWLQELESRREFAKIRTTVPSR